jgi:hypothetical protein
MALIVLSPVREVPCVELPSSASRQSCHGPDEIARLDRLRHTEVEADRDVLTERQRQPREVSRMSTLQR